MSVHKNSAWCWAVTRSPWIPPQWVTTAFGGPSITTHLPPGSSVNEFYDIVITCQMFTRMLNNRPQFAKCNSHWGRVDHGYLTIIRRSGGE